MLTKKEREEMMEYVKSEKKKVQDESEERKQFMQTMEQKRVRNERLTDLEQVRIVFASLLLTAFLTQGLPRIVSSVPKPLTT